MVRTLQLLGILLFLALFIGTGYVLVSKGGFSFLWQLFWLGFIIWMWGMTILIRLKDKDKMSEDYRTRDALFYQEKNKFDQLKISAISALLAITFFYSSISWIFKDNLVISIIILLITFFVSNYVQAKILGKSSEE